MNNSECQKLHFHNYKHAVLIFQLLVPVTFKLPKLEKTSHLYLVLSFILLFFSL